MIENKEERIKELAKDIGISFQLSGTTKFGPVAAELIEIGYQKIDKDKIVISKEEYEKQLEDKYYEGYHEGYSVGYYYGKQDARSADKAEPTNNNNKIEMDCDNQVKGD